MTYFTVSQKVNASQWLNLLMGYYSTIGIFKHATIVHHFNLSNEIEECYKYYNKEMGNYDYNHEVEVG